jgi:hypothetical protein
MENTLIQCPACHTELIRAVALHSDFAPCPACGATLRFCIFPAVNRPRAVGRSGETIMVEGESSCFYHPQKKAVLPCDGCGRFVCALCDCPLNGQHYCPTCLEAGRSKGKIKSLDNQRTLYDHLALALALYPLLTIFGIYFTLITGPAALYIAIRYWKAPPSLVHHNRIRFVFALILASLQIGGWLTLFIVLATRS